MSVRCYRHPQQYQPTPFHGEQRMLLRISTRSMWATSPMPGGVLERVRMQMKGVDERLSPEEWPHDEWKEGWTRRLPLPRR